jgi:pyruvate,orthophosphate dikinase
MNTITTRPCATTEPQSPGPSRTSVLTAEPKLFPHLGARPLVCRAALLDLLESSSHAAVVARAMGRPAVVGAADLSVDVASVRAAGQTVVPEGTLIAIDGTGGEVVLGSARTVTAAADPHLERLLGWADDVSGGSSDRGEAERLSAAHAVLRRG